MRTITLIALSLAAMPALAQDSLQRCRALTDGAARLACYDALADAARVPAPAALPVTPAQASATAGPTAVTATTTPKPAVATMAATAAAPAAAATAAPRTAEAAFGLPEAKRPDAVASVDSTVGSDFSGWGPNSRIRLANGQVWQVIDGSSVALPEGARKVSVKRGMLSSFYLDFEGLKTSPRVRRVE